MMIQFSGILAVGRFNKKLRLSFAPHLFAGGCSQSAEER